MHRKLNLTEMMDVLRDETSGKKIKIGKMAEVLNSRGFRPLLIAPALITILPTGVIPGIPDVCALLIIFISVQILMRRSHPWIPKKISNFSFSRKALLKGLEKIKPLTKSLDQHIHPRMQSLTKEGIEPFIAILCILLAIGIMIMSFLPFLAILPAAGILFLGLGLSARDGLLLSISMLFLILTMGAVPYTVSQLL